MGQANTQFWRGGEVTPSRWLGSPVAGGAPGSAALSQEAESTALGSVSLVPFI